MNHAKIPQFRRGVIDCINCVDAFLNFLETNSREHIPEYSIHIAPSTKRVIRTFA